MPDSSSYYEDMGRRFLGLGNIKSKHWFCGLEPGGTDSTEWPKRWATFYGAAEVIDGRLETDDPTHARYFGAAAKIQATWGPLIRTYLAFTEANAEDASVLAYQRDRFLAGDGDTCLLELSGYAAPSLSTNADRYRFASERIARIRELLELHSPFFMVCYGVARRRDFELLIGSRFDDDGFATLDHTICALVKHPRPARGPALPSTWWITLGNELRRRSDRILISSDASPV